MRTVGLSGGRLLAHQSLGYTRHERLGSALILSSASTLRGQHRPHNLQAQNSRAFSLSSVAPYVEAGVSGTQQLFTELHVLTGTPWYVTIPLIALSVNLVGRLPITLYTRRVAQRRATLSPLLRAWYAKHAIAVGQDQTPTEELKKRTEKLFKGTTKRLFREWGVQRWKDFSFLAILPLWLTGIEAMRRLCGGNKGLLGTLLQGPQAHEATASSVEVAEAPAVVISQGMTSQAASPTDVLHLDQGSVSQLVAQGADPTLATEGCLWFPDLMVPDPLHILPLALSAVLLLRLLPTTKAGFEVLIGSKPPPSSTPVQTFGRPLHRALMIMAILIGPATMNLPAAMHLYWISSATITQVQSEVVNWYMKLPKSPEQICRGRESTIIRPPPPSEIEPTVQETR